MNQKWVAFLRIAIGVFFIAQGLNKLNWYTTSEFLRTSLDRYAQNPPPAALWYQQHVAYPGIEAWSRMIPTGEMLIGVALVLGLLTRAALIAAIALVVNYQLTSGTLFAFSFFANPYALVVLSCLFFLLASRAGSAFSIDGSARKKTSKAKT
ncbi:MAG TPA: DoxX family protein [Bacteroidota bacterium]|nr:DoxX family protein [Bacteroidota bacterium]